MQKTLPSGKLGDLQPVSFHIHMQWILGRGVKEVEHDKRFFLHFPTWVHFLNPTMLVISETWGKKKKKKKEKHVNWDVLLEIKTKCQTF